MKNKFRNRHGYLKFEKKLYMQIGILLGAYGLVVLFVYLQLDGRAGNYILQGIQDIFRLDYSEASRIYQGIFRNYKEQIIVGLTLIGLLILIKIFVSFMTKYFDEISYGLDSLIAPTDDKVILSPEMDFIASRMNQCKEILRSRESQAKEAEQKKDELVMYLAHDIRTPLTSVIGYLDLMGENPDLSDGDRQHYLDIASEKADKLQHLVEEFFEITRFNGQSMTLAMMRFDLSYMLMQLSDEFYPILAKKSQKIICRFPEQVMVQGDAKNLARVFRNVLKNAAAYGAANSDIIIGMEQKGQVHEVTIENQGADIPNEKIGTIFEKFYRADESRGTKEGNAGLGLAIAKEIILLHGGEIFAESSGGRTVFYVRLPAK